MDEAKVIRAVLWPSEEHYPRWREVCTDVVHDTYAQFVAKMQPMVDGLIARGDVVRKFDCDPDHMAEWCLANRGVVDTKARAAYVAMLAISEGTQGDG